MTRDPIMFGVGMGMLFLSPFAGTAEKLPLTLAGVGGILYGISLTLMEERHEQG